jgi:integrase/recombinase XerC
MARQRRTPFHDHRPTPFSTESPTSCERSGRFSTPSGCRTTKHQGITTSRAALRSTPAKPSTLSIADALELWLNHGDGQLWSPRTLRERRRVIQWFAWWIQEVQGAEPLLHNIDRLRVQTYLRYVRSPHDEGRWNRCPQASAARETRPSTVASYFNVLRSFFRFCLQEGWLEISPVHGLTRPRVPDDQVQPLSESQIKALVAAARESPCPERNHAMVLLLVDTGLRASELCALVAGDLQASGQLRIRGKGNKWRTVYCCAATCQAVRRCLQTRHDVQANEPLFQGERGPTPGTRMTISGEGDVIRNLGRSAGIKGVRCSPHTLRHTFAITFLRSGGNVLELKAILGHEDLKMVNRYVALASVDLAVAHRKASPVQALKLR